VVTGRHCRDLLMLRLSMLRVRMLVQSAGQNFNATLEICDPLVKPIESPRTIKLYESDARSGSDIDVSKVEYIWCRVGR
jgi:hypothetical protein